MGRTGEILQPGGIGFVLTKHFDGVADLGVDLCELAYGLGGATVGRGEAADNMEDMHGSPLNA
jgi:hypothetical protein